MRLQITSKASLPMAVTWIVRQPFLVVIFQDPQLQKRYERTVSLMKVNPPDQLPIFGLLDAWDWFRRIEGVDSAPAKEAIGHLLSPALRPALRAWYQRAGARMNPAATEFRDRLSKLAGEKFG